mmetsp:Transcript_21012/g.51643  ORF Transcript_21012/g.51643 Transcript_21012/m.51643 type:complete len:243 (-) Transcript_21012:210-938(-)
MPKKITVIGAVAALALASQDAQAFAPLTSSVVRPTMSSALFSEEPKAAEGAVFVPPEEAAVEEGDATSEEATEIPLEAAEMLGRGAAKAKRGKRKGGSTAPTKATKAAVTLAPEEEFYEGPPAITETIIPTISILTVVGIIPAAAAWARQAWVRYRITSRRIRVTSGVGGKDMAEIVYPDIVEIRTVKRLFGDGDMVAFLRDGAKFEMRNIPNFEETMEFILDNVDKDVADTYRQKGDVTEP